MAGARQSAQIEPPRRQKPGASSSVWYHCRECDLGGKLGGLAWPPRGQRTTGATRPPSCPPAYCSAAPSQRSPTDPREESGASRVPRGRIQLARLQQSRHRDRGVRDAAVDEARFYRTSEAYLYNLTAFAMSRHEASLPAELTGRLPPAPASSTTAAGSAPTACAARGRLPGRVRRLRQPQHRVSALAACAGAASTRRSTTSTGRPWWLRRRLLLRRDRARRRSVRVPGELEARRPGRREPARTAAGRHRPAPRAADRRPARPVSAAGRLRGYRVFWGRSHLLIYEPGCRGVATRAANGVRARRRGASNTYSYQ